MVLRSEILTKKSELPTPDQALPGRESAMPVPEAHFVNGRPLTVPRDRPAWRFPQPSGSR